MKTPSHRSLGVLVGFAVACGSQGESSREPASVSSQSLTETSGEIDPANPFFQSLGTNGRSCGSCHLVDQGWSISPAGLQARFDATGGTDPIFRPHDAANAPNADVSTVESRRAAYSMLLSRGVIRVGLPMKPTFEFTLVAVDDPYGWASATQMSMFRRPLPTTNLRFLTVLNWDGRSTPALDLTNIRLGLKNQSNGATVNHAQAAAPIADDVRESIVTFETGITTAQVKLDNLRLDSAGAKGGPLLLAAQPFFIGMNEPGQIGSTNEVFTLYTAWDSKPDSSGDGARREIAAGQRVFNAKTFSTGEGRTGTCSGCHSLPNVGASSSFRFFDVGVSSARLRTADEPLYTFQNIATGETIQTTDGGRALISGRWADMNRFKVPGLRGLAARAPYFHNGSAKTIGAVVDHYQQRFGIDFDGDEKDQLVKFLEAL